MSKRIPSAGDYEIVRTLVLSTGHITRKDARLLDRDIAPLISFPKARSLGTPDEDAFGYWVYVPNDRRDDRFQDTIATLRRIGYSQAFADLLLLAHAIGCPWIMLDRDGPRCADLRWFSW